MHKKFLKLSVCAITFVYPLISNAFFCPTNFNQIDFGMSPEQVTQACGKPDKEDTLIKQNENVPQEWSYLIPQTVTLGGTAQKAEGTLKTDITFNEKDAVKCVSFADKRYWFLRVMPRINPKLAQDILARIKAVEINNEYKNDFTMRVSNVIDDNQCCNTRIDSASNIQ